MTAYNLASRLYTPADWMTQAACKGHTWTMYDDHPEQAKAICATCPVIEECREYGQGERYGVWGGLTPKERGHRPTVFWVRCDVCREVFQTRSSRARTCSDGCRNRKYQARRAS